MSLLGIDVGTTGCKVIALSTEGVIRASAQREYDVIRPQPGWAELDSRAVWGLIREAIREVTAQIPGDPVAAICVSSMGEAMTPVSADRQILGNCLLGFDARGAETMERLAAVDPVVFYERTGNVVGGVFGGPKLIWQRDNWPALFESTYKFLGWASLVAYLLGAEPVMDYSLANRTLFFDLRAEAWSQETLDLVGMPRDKLPGTVQAGTVTGEVSPVVAEELGLPPGVKIVIGAHDQCATAVGAGVTRAGLAVYGLGTYICITPTYDTIPPAAQMIGPNLNVEHHALPGLYVSFYYNLTGGALLKWFRDTFAAVERDAAKERGENVYDLLLAEMPEEPTDLMVLPHFAPTGPPYYDENPAGLIAGLTLETSRGTFIKGLLEGVTYYFRDGIDRMARAGIAIHEYRVTGGGAQSDRWLQIKADILGTPLVRPRITEAGALGAAVLAGVGAGLFASPDEAVSALVKVDRVFEPDPQRHQQYAERFARYHLLYPFAQQLRG
jgi:xylulokinase